MANRFSLSSLFGKWLKPSGASGSSGKDESIVDEVHQLRRAVEELAILNELALAIGSSFNSKEIMQKLIRQILGAVSEFEKAMVVAKLRGARERKRRTGVKVEGRKSVAETKGNFLSLAGIANELLAEGPTGFSPT